jgi:hypothetical protein
MHMKSAQFKKRAPEEKRTVQMLVRWTEAEARTVRASALARSMETAEFIRRASLGRRADVDFVTEIVLHLSDFTRAIRAWHKEMAALGLALPEAELADLIVRAQSAMLRIGK